MTAPGFSHKITTPVKRAGLILAICLSVQLNALSAPFVHIHADTGHNTDHHDGRAAHRHLSSHDAGHDAGHDATAHHHRSDSDTDHRQPSNDGSTDISATEPATRFLGGVTAARASAITSLAEPVSAFGVITPNLVTVLMERQGPPVPTPPDTSPPPLRGPPR